MSFCFFFSPVSVCIAEEVGEGGGGSLGADVVIETKEGGEAG